MCVFAPSAFVAGHFPDSFPTVSLICDVPSSRLSKWGSRTALRCRRTFAGRFSMIREWQIEALCVDNYRMSQKSMRLESQRDQGQLGDACVYYAARWYQRTEYQKLCVDLRPAVFDCRKLVLRFGHKAHLCITPLLSFICHHFRVHTPALYRAQTVIEVLFWPAALGVHVSAK